MRTMRQRLPDIIIITLLFLLPLGFFFQQTLGGKTLIPTENLYQYEPYRTYADVVAAPRPPQNHLVSDGVLQNYQWKAFIKAQLSAGEVPLWNPHQFAGIPFLAAGQHSALYPLSAIYYLMPLPQAYGWFTVVNLWLAGVFTYLLGRGLGISRSGSMLAGVVYQFSGFTLASVVFQMMIGGLPWLPLILLMIEQIIRRGRLFGRPTSIAWVVIGAGAIGMNVLAGHVEITIYTLLIAGYFAAVRLVYRWRNTDTLRQIVRAGAWLLAMVALGVGLAAIQFIPLYDFVQDNWRAERSDYQTVVGFAHPTRDLLQFALPNFYGNPTHQRYFDLFEWQWVDQFENDANQPHTEWGIKNYVESALYLGILPLILAVYALGEHLLMWWRVRIRRTDDEGARMLIIGQPGYHLIFGVLALLSLTFMFGLPTYRMIYALPGINQLNSAFRWIFGLTVAVSILAGMGLDTLQRRAAYRQSQTETRLGYAMLALSGLLMLGLLGSYLLYPQLESTITRVVDQLALASNAFGTARMFYSYQALNLLVFALALGASGVIFAWVGRMVQYRGIKLWSVAVVVLVSVDLMIASWGFNPASDPRLLDFTPPSAQWLLERDATSAPFRYTTLEQPADAPIYNANSTLQYGLDDIRGYDSIIPRQYMDYMQAIAPQVQRDFNRIAPIFTDPAFQYESYQDALASARFNLLNVRYIVSDREQAQPVASWSLAYEDDAVRIWENPDAVPRAYLVDDVRDLPARVPPLTPIAITSDSGRELTLDLPALTAAQWLVISQNYADGWRVYVRPQGAGESDEQPLQVERVGEMFQGVSLDPVQLADLLPDTTAGYTLRLVYSPLSVQIGFFVSAMSTIALTLLLGMWLWRVFVGVNTADSSQTAKVARNSVAPIVLNLFNRGIDFVLAIVLYRLLSQEMVGVYNFAVVTFIFFDIFTNFGLDLLMMREVSREKDRGGFYLFNTSALRLGLSIAGMGILLVFLLSWQTTPNPLPAEGLLAIVLLYIGLFPASLSKGMTSLYYAHEQAEVPAAIATITTINKAVFSVIVLLLGWGIIGLAAVSILNNVLTLGVLVYQGRRFITGGIPRRVDVPQVRHMVNESYPLLLNHFLATIFFQIDILILQALRGATIQAEYSTSYKWLNALNIIPSFFTQALFPMMSRQATDNRDHLRQTYRFGIKLLFAVTLPLAIGVTYMAETMTLILAGAQYVPNGAIALQIMIWSIPIGWMNSLTQYALIALDLQRWITRAFFGAVAFNIISNLILIPRFGFQAAAVTTILSELVLFVPFAWLMHRGLGGAVGWGAILWRPLVAAAAMLAIISGASGLGMPLLLALVIGGAVYGAVLLALRPLDQQEMAILRPLLPARVQAWLPPAIA